MSFKTIPKDILSVCISYLDHQSHTKIPLVNSEFRNSFMSPTSFEGNTFKLSRNMWEYLLSSTDIEFILFKFKLAYKLEITPLQMQHIMITEKASFVLKYISRTFGNLSCILIDDCYQACDLFNILPVFNSNPNIKLHFRVHHDLDTLYLGAINQDYCVKLAHQIQLYLLANRNNHNLKHITYDNFHDFSDIYTTNIHIVPGLEKLSVIHCDEFTFSSNQDSRSSNIAHKIKELELTPICPSECLNEIRHLFQNNDSLETLTLSADAYSFGVWCDQSETIKEIMDVPHLQTINVIINNNCNQNGDFFCLLDCCLESALDLKYLRIEWLWDTQLDSLYVIHMLSSLVAKALERGIQVYVQFKMTTNDNEVLAIESLYGIERLLIKINNILTATDSNCSYCSGLLSKLTIDIADYQRSDNCDVLHTSMLYMDDIIKYVLFI